MTCKTTKKKRTKYVELDKCVDLWSNIVVKGLKAARCAPLGLGPVTIYVCPIHGRLNEYCGVYESGRKFFCTACMEKILNTQLPPVRVYTGKEAEVFESL